MVRVYPMSILFLDHVKMSTYGQSQCESHLYFTVSFKNDTRLRYMQGYPIPSSASSAVFILKHPTETGSFRFRLLPRVRLIRTKSLLGCRSHLVSQTIEESFSYLLVPHLYRLVLARGLHSSGRWRSRPIRKAGNRRRSTFASLRIVKSLVASS